MQGNELIILEKAEYSYSVEKVLPLKAGDDPEKILHRWVHFHGKRYNEHDNYTLVYVGAVVITRPVRVDVEMVEERSVHWIEDSA